MSTIPEKTCMLPTFQKWTFCKGLYRENDGPSIQGKRREKHILKLWLDESLCWMLSKSIKQIVSYRPFHLAIDETSKIPKKCWLFLYLKFTRVLQFSSTNPRLLDGYRYCMSTNRHCFCNTWLVQSVCVATVILWHAFVSHLGMFSKIEWHLF